MKEKFDIGVVGAGYVGLVTGACLAHIGHRVTCVDKDAGRIEELRKGRMPIYEPGLEEFATRGLRTRRLSFVGSDGLTEVVGRADIVFIAVDTPRDEDGSADLSSVGAVAWSIGRALSETWRERPLVVVNKSTVPVGSANYVSMLIQEGAAEVPTGNGSPTAPSTSGSSPTRCSRGRGTRAPCRWAPGPASRRSSRKAPRRFRVQTALLVELSTT